MKVELTEDEALVLSDWLDRVIAREDFAKLVDDRAVWSPLLTISGALETQLPMIFSSSYGEQLDAARARLLDEVGDFGEVGTTNPRGPTVRDSLLRVIVDPKTSFRSTELAGLGLAADAAATAWVVEVGKLELDGLELADLLMQHPDPAVELAQIVQRFEQGELSVRELDDALSGVVTTLEAWSLRLKSGNGGRVDEGHSDEVCAE